jgi:hypothetical protein
MCHGEMFDAANRVNLRTLVSPRMLFICAPKSQHMLATEFALDLTYDTVGGLECLWLADPGFRGLR